MNGTLKSLANPSTVRDKFSAFGELKCLSPRQEIYLNKLMYDELHMVDLKKINDEKHSNGNIDEIVKIDV